MPRALDFSGRTSFYDLRDQLEIFAPNRFWRDFDDAKHDIEASFAFLRCQLGVNTIRLLTANPSTLRADSLYHGFQPWYLADGSINPIYRDRLVQLLDIATKCGVRVLLSLVADVKNTEWECVNLTGEWTPCRSGNGDDSSLSAAVRQARERGPESVRFVRPGTARETFFLNYLRSLVPHLKDHPGLFAYEIGNENLLRWELNGSGASGHDWYHNQVGSFLRRLIAEVRLLDTNHLIASGEVGYYSRRDDWAPLAGEFGRIDDIDNLNGSSSFTLESLVDIVGAHLYNYISGDADQSAKRVSDVAARTSKPLVLGEFNYYEDRNVDVRDFPRPNPRRQSFYEMAAGLAERGVIAGLVLFDPIPTVMSDIKDWHPAYFPWDGQQRRGLVIHGRKVMNIDTRAWIFAYDPQRPFSLAPLPEAQYFAGLWRSPADEIAVCAQ